MKRSTVALVSGGLESAALVKELLDSGSRVYPCYVEAGLIWEALELKALEGFLEAISHERLEPLAVLSSPVTECYQGHWSLTGREVPQARSSYDEIELLGRNLLLLAKGALYAARCQAGALALGLLKGNPFPDATEAFFSAMAQAASLALNRPIEILTPFIHLDKEEVLRRASDLPLELTFSCISPREGLHCGQCLKCDERKTGFLRAGLTDPTTYLSP